MATNRLKSLYFSCRDIIPPSSNPYLKGFRTSNADGLISTLGSYSCDAYLWCIITAARQEKPSIIFEGNLNPPESRARHLT